MLCLCLLGGLAACRTKPAEEGLTSESPQSETDPGDVPEPEEPETVIPSAELSNYVIIYPENATDELVQAANALASAIGAQFGVSLRVKNDFYSDMIPGMEIGESEILLGATNREESAAFLQSLGFRDRGYTVIGKKVGDTVEFGGLLGYAPIMPVNPFGCEAFINRGGRIPAPIHSFKN